MRNIRLVLQYEGTRYHGWQVQPTTKDTIQGIVQGQLRKITGEDTEVIGAGRTDAGVHAIAQVAAFKTHSTLPAETFQAALNATLPKDIRIMNTAEAEEHFHPRFDAKGKKYFYLISTDRVLSPFLLRYVWRIPHLLECGKMREAAEYLKGTHDFSSFRASRCGARHPVRTITLIDIVESSLMECAGVKVQGKFIRMDFEADAFLRHMVRNIVGTLVEVGKGMSEPAEMENILNTKDRKKAGPTAPAHGLFLESVRY